MTLLKEYFSGPDGLKRSSAFIRFANMLAQGATRDLYSNPDSFLMTTTDLNTNNSTKIGSLSQKAEKTS